MTTSDSPEAEGDEFSPDFSVFSPCAFLLGSVPILQVANLTPIWISDSPEAEGNKFNLPSDRSVFSLCGFLLGSVPILQVANLTGQMRMSIVARIHIIAHDMQLYAASLSVYYS